VAAAASPIVANHRSSRPGERRSGAAGEPRRILVIANETCASQAVRDAIRARAHEADLDVLVSAPALPGSRVSHWLTSDVPRSHREASERLAASVDALRAAGVPARGHVGDADPLQALDDALRLFGPDEVIIATHPPDSSNWLERRVVERARERYRGLPITHVVAGPRGEALPAGGRVAVAPGRPRVQLAAVDHPRRRAMLAIGAGVVVGAGVVLPWRWPAARSAATAQASAPPAVSAASVSPASEPAAAAPARPAAARLLTVPQLVGHRVGGGRASLPGLRVQVVPPGAAGLVVGQRPRAGAHVRRGTTVVATVRTAPPKPPASVSPPAASGPAPPASLVAAPSRSEAAQPARACPPETSTLWGRHGLWGSFRCG